MSPKDLPAIPRAAPEATLATWIRGAEAPVRRPLVRLHAQVDPELRRRLKRAALERDTTVSALLRTLVEAWLREQGF